MFKKENGMKVKKLNKSSIKTNKAIREAFAELIQEKGNLSHVTVTDLVKKADITRSSFYTHYDSIYEVAQEIQDETLEVLIKNINAVKTQDDIEIYIENIFNYLKLNDKIYRMILSSNDPLFFAGRLNKYMVKEISNILNANNNDLLLKISFFCDGSMSLIIRYFRKEIDITLDEAKEYILKMANLFFKI